ncbi:hypothetical protein V1505DRAFT_359137 [Lipomyces doorenjongii]
MVATISTCEHIANGHIKVKGAEINYFTEDSVVFKDGSVFEDPELVVLATLSLVSAVKNLKQVWGLDEESEINSCLDSGRAAGRSGFRLAFWPALYN